MSVPEDEEREHAVAEAAAETAVAPVDAAPSGLAPATSELDELKRECADLRDQLLRRRAEFENYKRRVERDRQLTGIEATASLLKALIPTLDNLDRALFAGGDEQSVRAGVELIRREMLALLEAQGVTIEDPQGAPFDPESHQALTHEPVPGFAEGTVVAVFGKGYRFRERLLRPALVKVAKAQEIAEGQSAEDGGVVH